MFILMATFFPSQSASCSAQIPGCSTQGSWREQWFWGEVLFVYHRPHLSYFIAPLQLIAATSWFSWRVRDGDTDVNFNANFRDQPLSGGVQQMCLVSCAIAERITIRKHLHFSLKSAMQWSEQENTSWFLLRSCKKAPFVCVANSDQHTLSSSDPTGYSSCAVPFKTTLRSPNIWNLKALLISKSRWQSHLRASFLSHAHTIVYRSSFQTDEEILFNLSTLTKINLGLYKSIKSSQKEFNNKF